MQIDLTLRLPQREYFEAQHPKSLIVLHHTVGASARSTFEYWLSSRQRIGTAYIIERDGTVFEVFPPECWAHHIGSIATRSGHRIPARPHSIDRRSIGIELASEGPLMERECVEGSGNPSAFYAFGGKQKFDGLVWRTAEPWRGCEFFASYTEPQFVAAVWLVRDLCERFGIPPVTPRDPLSCNPAFATWKGVLGHAHLRPDKTDPQPQLWDTEFLAAAGLETQ